MNRPTISTNYTKKHGMVLIGYTTSTFKESQGKLITKPSAFETKDRDLYANLK
jgi:hypothetical protein